MPIEKYRDILNPAYLNQKFPIDSEIVSVTPFAQYPAKIDYNGRLASRERIDKWKDRNFPATRAENIKILDDYLTLCEKNNARPIMILPPMSSGYLKHFSRQKLQEFHYLIGEAIKKHSSAMFVDFWKVSGLTEDDFLDVDHLNAWGATKFSHFFNQFIENL